MISESRKEYLKRYRQQNAERMKQYNRENYLKRKKREKEARNNPSFSILVMLQNKKKQRLSNMSEARKRRRERTQSAIYEDIKKDTHASA